MKQMPNSKIELAATVVLFILAALGAWAALDWQLHAKLFPLVLLVPLMVLLFTHALLTVVTMARGNNRVRRSEQEAQKDDNDVFASVWASRENRWRVIILLTWMLGFVVAISLLGFSIGTSLLAVAYLRVSRTPWSQCLLIGLGNYLALRIGFERVLGMPLNAGVIADYLGISRVDDPLIAPFITLLMGQ